MELAQLHWFWTGFLYGCYILGFLVSLYITVAILFLWIFGSDSLDIEALILLPFVLLVIYPGYPTAFVKWFATDYYTFWDGFIDFIWCFFPILNLGYAGDWYIEIMENIIQTTIAFFSAG